MSESGPVQGQGSSHFLETSSNIFEAKGEVDSGIPLERGIEPSTPTEWSRDPYDNSLALWRVRPWLPADPNRTGHGLPLEFPTNNSPEVIRTCPSRVVQRSHPPPCLKDARGSNDKDGQSHDRPHARKGSGACPQLTDSNKRGPNAPQGLTKITSRDTTY
jgi:hypothetical protein